MTFLQYYINIGLAVAFLFELSHPASCCCRHCSKATTPYLAMKVLRKIVRNLTYLMVLLLMSRLSKSPKMVGRNASRRVISSWRSLQKINKKRKGYGEWMGGSVDGWMRGWMNGRMRGWINTWINGWVDERMDRWMYEWMDGWTNE